MLKAYRLFVFLLFLKSVQRYFFLTAVFFSFLYSVSAQKYTPYKLIVFFQGSDSSFLKSNCKHASYLQDSFQYKSEIRSILNQCFNLSFLQAHVVSTQISDSVYTTVINAGQKYKWVSLRKGNVPLDVLSSAGFREEQFNKKYFNKQQYASKIERMLVYLEEHGYPFSSIALDSIEADSNTIRACLKLEQGPWISFDTLELLGDANIHKWFLEKYLGIKSGKPYNERLIRDASSRLSQLPFLKTNTQSGVYFFDKKAMPVFNLGNRKASSVDGILGFAPNSSLNNKLVITGEANLKLQNLFSSGKALEINYRSFLSSSQDLKVKALWPYIFKSNVALDYQLDILKLDSTFLDVKNELGFQYRFIGNDYIKVFYSIQTSTTLYVDTNIIKVTRQLPTSTDMRYNQYGIGLRKTKYDYFLNPRKGFGVEIIAGLGDKTIVRNAAIQNLKLYNTKGESYNIYDSIKTEFLQYKIQLNTDAFFPLYGRSVLRIQFMAAHLQADQLFVNDVYRIGGIRTLKGFDEQAIFASSYAIINTELRYLLQQNSNFILFWNGAWYQNKARTPVMSDKPYGFGAGMNFETGAGIFSIFYAVGKQMNNQIEFDKAKVHFGFVNYF